MKKMLALALAMAPGPTESQESKKTVRVVTTLNVFRHVAEKIGGGRVSAAALAHPKRDPHYLQADPVMQKTAGGADLFIQNGRSLDLWANDVVQHSGNVRIQTSHGRLTASHECSVLEMPRQISKEWGDIHPEGNPHVWLDPLNLKQIARNTHGALCAVDPAGRATYDENLKLFGREIDEAMFGKELVEEYGGEFLWRKIRLGKLDDALQEDGAAGKLGGWMRKARALKGVKVLSYHKTYAYFAERFGFHLVAELEEKPGIAPPPKHLEDLLDLVKREDVRIILNDVFYPTDAANYVASKTGAKVLVVPIDVGGVEGVNSYVALIEYILDRMVSSLQ